MALELMFDNGEAVGTRKPSTSKGSKSTTHLLQSSSLEVRFDFFL